MKRLSLAVAALAFVCAAALFWLPGFGAPPPSAPTPAAASTTGDATAANANVADRAAAMGIAGTEPGNDRAPVPDVGAAATTGSLCVTVVWGRDHAPAVDIVVRARPRDRGFAAVEGRTGKDGTCTFAGLPVGEVRPTCQHVETVWSERVAVTAGARTEVTLTIPAGLDAKGRVVDGEQRPIADADIVYTGWTGGDTEVVGRSAADGTFALRAMPKTCHLGARKQGYCPSSMRTFTTEDGAEVDFTIVLTAGGGTLAGTVFGPDGRPVAGAEITAGSREQNLHNLPDGGTAMGPQRETVRSDERGRFEIASVVPGKVPVLVKAAKLSPWGGDVDVPAGRTETITVNLLPGVTLTGVVKDGAGKAVADADVRVGDWDAPGYGSTTTAADGSYRLEGLMPGTFDAIAHKEKGGHTKAELRFVAGETVRWDPALDSGLVLRGRVLDDDGKAVAQVMLEVRPSTWQQGDDFFRFVNSAADGTFAIEACPPGRALHLSLRRRSTFPELELRDVVPGTDELVIRLPAPHWTNIKGVVLGADDKVVPNVSISTYQVGGSGGSPVDQVDARTGAFAVGPCPPGTYSLRITTGGYPTLRFDRTLQPDETWDLGTVHFAVGGRLVAHLIVEGTPPKVLRGTIHDTAGGFVERDAAEDGVVQSSPLAAGDYELQTSGDGLAVRVVPFTVRAGEATTLDVPLSKGVAVEFVCELPAAETKPREVTLVVRDVGGAVACRATAWSEQGPWTVADLLPPGRYSLTASASGVSGAATFVVEATKVTVPVTLAATGR